MAYDEEWLQTLREHVQRCDLPAIHAVCLNVDAGRDPESGLAAARLLAATAFVAVALVARGHPKLAACRSEYVTNAVHHATAWRDGVNGTLEGLGAPNPHALNDLLQQHLPKPEVAIVKLYTLWWLDVVPEDDQRLVDRQQYVPGTASVRARFAYVAGNAAHLAWLRVGRLPFFAPLAIQHPQEALLSSPERSFSNAMDQAIPGHWWQIDHRDRLEGRSCQGVAAALAECLERGWTPRDDVQVMAEFRPDGHLGPVRHEWTKGQLPVLAVPPGTEFRRGEPLPPNVKRFVVIRTRHSAARVLAGRRRPPWWVLVLLAAAVLATSWTLATVISIVRDHHRPPAVVGVQPSSGSIVSQQQGFSGRTSGLAATDELYAVVVPQTIPHFFPQPGPVAEGNQQWVATFTFGQGARNGDAFRLLLVIVSPADRQAFTRYLAGGDGGLAALSQRTRILFDGQYSIGNPPAHVEIRSPAPGDSVAGQLAVSGVADRIPAGQTLWLIVKVGDGYYPQGAIDTLADGNWSEPVQLGSGPDPIFTLLVVQADAGADDTFKGWIRGGSQTGNYPAMHQGVDFPSVLFLASVTVKHP
jgi:hypothetical protein